MADSFQKEIPKARVNITLDVETNGAKRKKELPLKMLVLGDFSCGKTSCAIADRERININKGNFTKVMSDLGPRLDIIVANKVKADGSEMCVNFSANEIKQFRPEFVVQQVPELRNLLAMRNLLKDLKANLLDNVALRRELEKILHDKSEIKKLQTELNKAVPLQEKTVMPREGKHD